MKQKPVYIKIDEYGGKRYYSNKKMTRLHREDGPAVEYADGSKEWYIDGQLHREDGPAVEYADGDKYWYIDGELHREDGPAVEWLDGGRFWYANGERHRLDGPAVEYASGTKYWYIDGNELTEEEFIKRTAPEIVLTKDEIAAKFGIDVTKLKIVK